QAVAPAFLRNVDDAGADRVRGGVEADPLALQRERAAGGARDAEQRLAKFGAARADEAVDAEYLPAPELEGDVVEFRRVAVVLDRENGRPDGHLGLRKDVLDVAADHQPDDLVLWSFRKFPLPDGAPVAEDDEVLGDLVDLVELVADEQDGLALPLEPFDDAEEVVDLLARQRGRRLVHDDDPGFDRKRTGDRHQMALGDGEIPQPDRRIDLAFELTQQVTRQAVDRLPVDRAEAGARRMAEKDVLADGEFVE